MEDNTTQKIQTMLTRYFTGELNDDSRHAVEEWIHASDQNRAIAEQMKDIYQAARLGKKDILQWRV